MVAATERWVWEVEGLDRIRPVRKTFRTRAFSVHAEIRALSSYFSECTRGMLRAG